MRNQPVLGPGWAPLAAPSAPSQTWPRVRRQLLIVGGLALLALFSGVLRSPNGWLAVGLGWAVVGLLANHRAEGRTVRTVVEYAAVAALAVIVATAAPIPPTQGVKERAPVKVEAGQGAGQLEDAREGVVNLWEQIATGFSRVSVEAPKKEGR